MRRHAWAALLLGGLSSARAAQPVAPARIPSLAPAAFTAPILAVARPPVTAAVAAALPSPAAALRTGTGAASAAPAAAAETTGRLFDGPSARETVVVVGAGFAGLEAALRLSHEDVDVVVIDRENHHVFRPLLYQVATGVLSPEEIAHPIRRLLRDRPNVRVVRGDVRGVDLGRKTVALDGRELRYDRLILAAGTRPAYFGHDDWAAHAPALKDVSDAAKIRRRVLTAFEAAEQEPDPKRRAELMTFVVIGGGAAGVEMAGALAELARSLQGEFRAIDPRRARVVLVEGGPKILPFLDEKLGASAREALSRLGVDVRTGTLVTNVSSSGVETKTGPIAASVVLWTSGAEGSPLSRTLGAPLDKMGRVQVLPDLSIPGHPEAFVVGDLAAVAQDGKPVPSLARPAIQMGRHAAENVARALRGLAPKPFRFSDPGSLAIIGRHAAVGRLFGVPLAGLGAWLAWLAIHAAFLRDARSRLLVCFEWLWSYATGRRGARVI